MSRIGFEPITIEDGVDVMVNGQEVTVKGPKGELKINLPGTINAQVNQGQIEVTRKSEDKQSKSLHGTFRMHIANAIKGVKDGFSRKLEIVGVGYRVKKEGNNISLSLGLNHPVVFEPPMGVQFEVPDEVTIIVSGYDKQKVGEVAASIRESKKPEPYKGKGIRYEGEYVRRKSSKSAAK